MSEIQPIPPGNVVSPEDQVAINRERLRQHPSPIVQQFASRCDDSDRAEDLFGMSDHMMMSFGQRLGESCVEANFEVGADYVALRLATLFAIRRRDSGLLFTDQVVMLDRARHALMRFVRP